MSDVSEKTDLNSHLISVGKICLFLILIICLAAAGYYYFQLIRKKSANYSAANQVSALEQQLTAQQAQITTLQNAIGQLQQVAQQSQVLSAKQEQIISDWQAVQKGDMDKWYMAEAQYLVKLANDHAQYTHNIPLAITLLQRADQVLLPLQETTAIEVRQALAANLAALQAMPQVDMAALYAKLTNLDIQFNQLTLLSTPLSADAQQLAAPTISPNDPWWKKSLDHTWQVLRQIIIVRNTSSTALPLVLPEEKSFLYQSLHAEMQNAMWAVLHNQPQVFKLSMQRQIAWLQQYFVNDAATQAMINELTTLSNANLEPQTVDLSATLQLFNKYFSRAGAV